MKIEKKIENLKAEIILSGRLDTTTAPELEKELDTILMETKDLTFNLTDLEYISSAGLRILLRAQKVMNNQGDMRITGANETVMEVFEITGFSEILTIV